MRLRATRYGGQRVTMGEGAHARGPTATDVERVHPRGWGSAAVDGALVGVMLGVPLGLLLGMFGAVTPLVSALQLGFWDGGVLGAFLSVARHFGLHRARRMDTIPVLRADRFEVCVDAAAADRARSILTTDAGSAVS